MIWNIKCVKGPWLKDDSMISVHLYWMKNGDIDHISHLDLKLLWWTLTEQTRYPKGKW